MAPRGDPGQRAEEKCAASWHIDCVPQTCSGAHCPGFWPDEVAFSRDAWAQSCLTAASMSRCALTLQGHWLPETSSPVQSRALLLQRRPGVCKTPWQIQP